MAKLTVLSFGGGQDSSALLDMYIHDHQGFRAKYAPEDFLVIMSSTGDEHPETNSHVEKTKEKCKKHGIEFVLITPDMGYHYSSWQSLRGFYNLKNTVGSKAFPKTCTDKLKIQPIYKFLEDWLHKTYRVKTGRKVGFKEFSDKYGKINMIIGIAKGEEVRVSDPNSTVGPVWRRESVQNIYPLIDLGFDRRACQEYIASLGEIVPPPSNCMLCPFMSETELLWLYRKYPDDFNAWVLIEKNKINANKHMENSPVIDKTTGEIKKYENRNLGVWGKKLLPEVLEIAKTKYGHMTDAELDEYKFSHGHCVKSKY